MFTTVEEILQAECTKVPNDYKRVRQQNLLLAGVGGGGGGGGETDPCFSATLDRTVK